MSSILHAVLFTVRTGNHIWIIPLAYFDG